MQCNQTGMIYIGSTAEAMLSNRISGHRQGYKAYVQQEIEKNYVPVVGAKKKARVSNCKSFKIVEIGDFEYDTIEYFECNSKRELGKRERHYIELYKAKYGNLCVNKNIPTRTAKEYNEDNKVYIAECAKKYKIEHKVQIAEYRKKYGSVHKVHSAECKKKYNEENKALIAEYQKKYTKSRRVFKTACDSLNLIEL
jgi:hypothetical protein